MEIGIIISLISASFGAGISLLSTHLSSKSQLKRDKLKYHNEFKLERLRIENDSNVNYRTELLRNIERLNIILGKIGNSISLTTSVIQSSNDLESKKFDKNYLIESSKLVELESICLAFFPDLFYKITRITELHNINWGHQRLLLKIDIRTNRESYISMQNKIIEISNQTSAEINSIQREVINISETIKNKYIA